MEPFVSVVDRMFPDSPLCGHSDLYREGYIDGVYGRDGRRWFTDSDTDYHAGWQDGSTASREEAGF